MKHLREVYNRYSEGLRGLDFVEMIPVDVESGELPLLNDVRSPIREKVRSYLSEHGIETCNFHPPVHLAPYLKRKGAFSNSTSLAGESFHLPCGPDQPIENVEYCIELLHKFKT
jgi:dTDP-4-amino-4,6-dideoxygalactose transaminase